MSKQLKKNRNKAKIYFTFVKNFMFKKTMQCFMKNKDLISYDAKKFHNGALYQKETDLNR